MAAPFGTLIKVPIVGRPNVGKSTLFNRLAERTRRQTQAIVSPHAGTTRDRREGAASLAGACFVAVDTGGLEEASVAAAKAEYVRAASAGGGGAWLNARIQEQVAHAVQDSEVAIFMVDARDGITTLDRHFAEWARRLGTRTHWILLVNKAEQLVSADDDAAMQALYAEALELRLGSDVIFTSAQNGDGMASLTSALLPFIERDGLDQLKARAKAGTAMADDTLDALGTLVGGDAALEDAPADMVELAIVGRPNVGKSSLLNRLLGQDRVLVGPVPGLTRDAVSVDWEWRGRRLRLVDTAGLRRSGKRDRSTELEELSATASMHALKLASVVVLVLDAETQTMLHSELSLSHAAIEEGRALVIAANKADLLTQVSRDEYKAGVLAQVRALVPQHGDLPVVAMSALTGEGVDELLPAVVDARDRWCRRIGTGVLNRWLAAMERHHPPPNNKGKVTRLKYITQLKGRPPTFVVWVNRINAVPDSYVSFLRNNLRDEFGFEGIPIRVLLRSTSKKLQERVAEQTQQQQEAKARPTETTVRITPVSATTGIGKGKNARSKPTGAAKAAKTRAQRKKFNEQKVSAAGRRRGR